MKRGDKMTTTLEKKFRQKDKEYTTAQKIIAEELNKRIENYLEANETDKVPGSVMEQWINELIKEEELPRLFDELYSIRIQLENEKKGG